MIQTSYDAKAATHPNAIAISQGIPDGMLERGNEYC